MKQNVGKIDAFIRIVIALIISALFITHTIINAFAQAAIIIGGILLFTGIMNFCPLYFFLKINTCKR
jgi:hypothetical protein